MSRAVPSYRRHPNGQAFVQIKGRRIYLGKWGSEKSKRRYSQLLEQLGRERPAAAIPAPSAGRTIVELILIYDEWARRYYSKNGKPSKEYTSMMAALKPLDEVFGEDPGDMFGPRKLEAIQEHLINAGIVRSSINHQISRIKRFFRWCCRKELIPQSIYHGLLSVPGLVRGMNNAKEAEAIEPVDRRVVEVTLPHMTPVVAAMVKVQLYCAMRPAEVCGMRGCEIDTRGDVWLYTPAEHKNAWREQARIIPIPRVAQDVLRQFLREDQEQYLFSPRESEAWRKENWVAKGKPNRKTPIYPSELRQRGKAKEARRRRLSKRPKRERYDTDSYRRAITYAIARGNRIAKAADPLAAEIPHWHPHQLRHTISTVISQVIGEQAAQRWLGHENLETTGIYTQKQVKELVEIARALDRRWHE